MPRANRHILPGYVYHLTHRCHDRKFLLGFQRDRNAYRDWLREGSGRYGLSVLGYCITSNHVHLVVVAPGVEAVSRTMQLAAGCSAGQYNARKGRKGAFWEDRYAATLVESGEHLLNCLAYVDLNMVRAGVVEHPSGWEWCGWREVTGLRTRYRVLDLDGLAESLRRRSRRELAEAYERVIEQKLAAERVEREARWTESLAVGSEQYVREVAGKIGRRRRIDIFKCPEMEGGTWRARESAPSYMRFSPPKKRR